MNFINPYTDFGFKKLFGEEASKDLLQDFLNQMLPEHHKIAKLHLRPSNRLGEVENDRQAIFDLSCLSSTGERFIVEMQKAEQNFFKDRTIYYSTFPIREQARKGAWDYRLEAVYCVGVLDFVFDENNARQDVLCKVNLQDQHGEVFYDKLTYLYLQMPYFNKSEDELVTHFDKWLYFLKNLATLDNIPAILREPIFEKGFEVASLAAMDEDELLAYEHSLKIYRDIYSIVTTAEQKGEASGMAKGIEKGMAKGLELGKAAGKAEANAALLRRLLENGMREAEARALLDIE